MRGYFVCCRDKWKLGDMMKMPKFLGKEGRERRSQRGKAVATTKLLKWDHIGTVQKPLLKVLDATFVWPYSGCCAVYSILAKHYNLGSCVVCNMIILWRTLSNAK